MQLTQSRQVENPYRQMFVAGAISALLGVSMWFLFSQKLIPFYPREAHANIMFFGFFWSFVAGFLMTAIPRMTATHFASAIELNISLALVLIQLMLSFFNYASSTFFIYAAQLGFLVFFIARRVSKGTKTPFDGFLFLPFAFISGLTGLLFFLISKNSVGFYLFAGEAFLLNLIVGLGSRLIPALSRLPNSTMHPGVLVKPNWWRTAILALLLNATFIGEYLRFEMPALIIRSLLLIYISTKLFGLFKKWTNFTYVGLGLKTSLLFLIGGYLFKAFNYSVANSHLVFIGGFALITLMVATRVTVAHSQSSLDYEMTSKRVLLIILLLVSAAVMRSNSQNVVQGSLINGALISFVVAIFLWVAKHLQLKKSKITQKN